MKAPAIWGAKMLDIAEPHVLSLNPYVPGKPVKDNIKIIKWSKLASNENCLGVSPLAKRGALEGLELANIYPNAKRLMP